MKFLEGKTSNQLKKIWREACKDGSKEFQRKLFEEILVKMGDMLWHYNREIDHFHV